MAVQIAQSDAEGTEQAAVEAALTASREQFDCQYEVIHYTDAPIHPVTHLCSLSARTSSFANPPTQNLEASLIASLERQTKMEKEAEDVSEATAQSELVATQVGLQRESMRVKA
jgi:hypothetical protein